MDSVYIGTPVTRDLVTTGYCATVAGIVAVLTQQGINSALNCLPGHDVSQQRDVLADQFLKTDLSHLLMIDDDMSFDASAVLRLLAAKKDVIGIPSPLRAYRLDILSQLIKGGFVPEAAMSLAHSFNMDISEATTITEGAFRVDTIGFGIMMVSRECLVRMREKGNLPRYFTKPSPEPVTGFFGRLDLPSGERVPEDYSFCMRWREMGGEVWALADVMVGHVGAERHTANFADVLRLTPQRKS